MLRRVLLQSLLGLGRQLGLLLWLLVLVPLALLLAANTGPGQRLLVWGIAEVTDGQVLLEGLGGGLPTAPRLRRLELRDDRGPWLVAEDLALDLNLRALLRAEILVDRLSAATLGLLRLPEGGGGGAAPGWPPLRIRLDQLAIADLRLDPAFPKAPPLVVKAHAALGGQGPLEIRGEILARDRTDHYRLGLRADPQGLWLDLDLREQAAGLVPALGDTLGWPLPAGLGDWRIEAHAEGPYSALALKARLAAGAAQASAEGLLDLEARATTALRLEARAPAMTAPGAWPIDWKDLALSGEVAGPWAAPEGQARLLIQGLAAGDLGLDRLTLEARSEGQRLTLVGVLQGPRGPAPLPESAWREPLRLSAGVGLAGPSWPFALDLTHPLLALEASGQAEPPAGQVQLRLLDLTPLARLAGLDLAGGVHLQASAALDGGPHLEACGSVALTRAPAPLPRLLGPEARGTLAARREGDAWRLDRMEFEGVGFKAAGQGTLTQDAVDLGWTLAVPDLATLGDRWSGQLRVQGGLSGPARAPDLAAELDLEGAYAGLGAGQVQGRIGARLREPSGVVELGGDWAGLPLALDLLASPGPGGALLIGLKEVRWAGLSAYGDLRLAPGAVLPQGELRIQGERLADLSPLLSAVGLPPGEELDGRLDARLRLQGDEVRLDAGGDGLVLPGGIRVGALALGGRVRDPWDSADSQGRLELSGLAFGTTAADLSVAAQGPLRDLRLTADSGVRTSGGPVDLRLAGRLDAAGRRLTLERLEAQGWGERLRLLDPTEVALAEGLRVERLRLGLREGTLELAGRLLPPLATEIRLAGLPLGLAALLSPGLSVAGTLDGEAQLKGPIEALTGSIRLGAGGLRLTRGDARGLPPAEVQVVADLGPAGTRVEASARAGGETRLALRGNLDGPLRFPPGDLDLMIDGHLDLALLDPLLTGSGRQAAGQVVLDARLTAGATTPRLAGTARLTEGAFWDRTTGVVLTRAQGRLVLAGDSVRVEGLTAEAGTGRLTLEGSVGALAPGVPVDLRLAAKDASPLQLDRLKVQGSGELRLTGAALGRLEASGALRLKSVDIRLPERLPAQVVTLEVREVGQRRAGTSPAPTGPGWRPDLGLDLLVSAPRSVLVRGRGVDAELGGEVRVRGTVAEPVLSGRFELRHGDYELAGQTLRFSRGRLGFDGATGLNPSLDLEARVTVAGGTAILAVEGTARSPRIALRGEPEMPEDEVLARLLFGIAGGRLTPWQATRLGLAAASLAGLQVAGPGLLDRVGQGLGLRALGLGRDAEGGVGWQGGRQLSERVYLGTRQGSRTGEPQAVLRVEAGPRIQLEADVGPIGGTRAGAAFEIEY